MVNRPPYCGAAFDYSNRLSLFLFILATVGCHGEPPSQAVEDSSGGKSEIRATSDITRIADEYRTLRLMTPVPVVVNPEFILFCVGASKEMVDAARVDHGPHANSSVSIFMNESAADAYTNKSNYPVGAIIVKEKQRHGYRANGLSEWQDTADGVGGMVKRDKGFDSANGDWEYFYFETINNIESGRLSGCIECHSKAKETDYVFGHWSGRNTFGGASSDYGY